MFAYVRDLDSGRFWSVTHQPTLKPARSYEASFSQGRADFRLRDENLETHLEIAISPEDDVEVRRITVANHGHLRRNIELTSYAEVVLAAPAAEAAHPAFANLFVQTEIVPERQALLCTRRPRSAAERPPWMLHLMAVNAADAGDASYETDRAAFIGRGRSLDDPAAMHASRLQNSQGSVLDPITSIRRSFTIEPDETVVIDIVTGVAETRETAQALIDKYHDRRLTGRVFDLAWTHSQVILRQLDATEAEAQVYDRLASSVLYASPLRRAPADVLARNRRGQPGLWGYGVSGDFPIVLVRVSNVSNIELVRQCVRAHAYWRMKGLAVDLVILNEDTSGYRQNLHDQIIGMIAGGTEVHMIDRPGGIFVRRADQITDDDKGLLQTAARVVLSDAGHSLAEQAEPRRRTDPPPPRFTPLPVRRPDKPKASEPAPWDLAFFNGLGGFTRDGREYIITLPPGAVTPAPWINVLANADFGTVVTESGGGYTWGENAHEFRLTPWYNDAVTDVAGEAFYIRDEETGRFWSPAPLPARGSTAYTTRHGFGYTVFEHTEDGISSEMSCYVAVDAPVKFIAIKIRNDSNHSRRLSLTGFVEWVLGEQRAKTMLHVITEIDSVTGAMLARNPYNAEFPERVAFFTVSEPNCTVAGSRNEFLGRTGTPAQPAAMYRSRLSGRVGAGLDPCGAMQVTLAFAAGQEREVVFMLGAGRNLDEARGIIQRFAGAEAAKVALKGVWDYWNGTLGAVHIETPDPSVDILVNGWLVYQVLSCRLWARSGFYQSGGAFGFRDQLQDVMALLHAEPRLARSQLLLCASRQFADGDVQHWWHPPQGRGVRTRISDDYLWLPYATSLYVRDVGDTGALDESIRFLDGRILRPDEEGYYDLPVPSEESATLYEHCVRAIRFGLKLGAHGLPLMGTGDWNDGMNLVGAQGAGESVWLALFQYDVLTRFAEIAAGRNDPAFAQLCLAHAATLRQNVEQNAWDGQWYRRAYFDNGDPLGSTLSPECQIDSIPQSWAVLSGAGDPVRVRSAMEAVDARLVRRDTGLIKLFDPPFDQSQLDPGYIKGYIPGVRENGGQYTHAAAWTVMAFAAMGDAKKAWELLALLNPINHGSTRAGIEVYKVEPYVIAADVYANPQHLGRGGWTWYTGSAGWMYRLITESLLGLRLEVDHLRLQPLLPADWKSLKIHYRYRETFHHILIRNNGGKTVTRVTADGVDRPDGTIPLIDDRQEHQAEVDLG